ncbi:helix-turn-helix protein [Melghiribacillus thermohalophilus]|uniref:Helix-turn-helix protein n=1 Tax=Melghiribacillus thermohalophilus TaxID=1324956 RepID=A0A4R3MZ52_9BACI|nr:helix-turn-helix domain-containing protein [Melghiribacillus thermohalophilus]TCT21127.1 helix-turn-helix protein [Melghiribacillus thermohalophilus]
MDNTLYDLAKKSKEDNQALQMLIDLFEPKIKKSLTLTNYTEREDLSQELKYKLVITIKEYDIESTPGFWDLLEQFKENSG